MLNYEEMALRLKAALAKSIAESIKRELVEIVNTKDEAHLPEGFVRLRRELADVASFGDLHDYMDANMIPPEAEWLLGEPLVTDGAFGHDGDQDGVQLACDVLNEAQRQVDDWLRTGGLREEVQDGIPA